MRFDRIAKLHYIKADEDYPSRTREIKLMLSLLDGTFYDVQPYQSFDVVWSGGSYVVPFNRRPNVATGTVEIRNQIERQAQMTMGAMHFPSVDTPDPKTRKALQDWIAEANLPEVMVQAIRLGQAGSIALIFKVREDPDQSDACRVWVEVKTTEYLTPTFNSVRREETVEEKFKVSGKRLHGMGYDVPKEDLRKQFWWMRVFSRDAETWFVPWLVSEEKEKRRAGEVFHPEVDEDRTVQHNFFQRCPVVWVKNLTDTDDVDGACGFKDGIEMAVALDFLESMIFAANVYTTSPQAVIRTPAPTAGAGGATERNQSSAGGGAQGLVMTSASVLTIDEKADAFFLEIKGDGIEKAKSNAKDTKRSVIEAVHGDRIDPTEVTQNHQGAKSLELLNQALLARVGAFRLTYGNALKRLLRMFLEVAEKQTVLVNDRPVELGVIGDVNLRFGGFYPITAAEKFSEAQAHDLLIKNGLESRENATKDIAEIYHIADVAAERVAIAADRAEDDARELKLSAAARLMPEAK